MGHLLTVLSKKRIIVQDGFNRPNGSLGKADTGQTWQVILGTWEIQNNTAVTTTTGTNQLATINSGLSDGTIQGLCASAADVDTRLFFRVQDGSNWFVVDYFGGQFRLVRSVALTYTVLGSYTTAKPSSYAIRVVVSGAQITVYMNGLQIFSVQDTNFKTATSHGIGAEKPGGSFDNFLVGVDL